ncbi:MAG: 5'/3'-nucleotidase SurE [Deltaproteobacteria bacterium]|nr:5'/3'-nucleotidase SurE [Deltaproteobacteria bacterium]
MRILLTNDDGITAPGLAAARAALEPLGELLVVAPEHEQSAVSHSITLNRPLRMREVAPRTHAVDGTPGDCVLLACEVLLRDLSLDLVVSGINAGGNLGSDVIYSGTVGAAMEGALRGLPAIAISLVGYHDLDFSLAARFLGALAEEVLANGVPAHCVLNVNVPKRATEPARYRLATLGEHRYGDVVEQRLDPRGRPYYWIGGHWKGFESIAGSDCVAIGEGCISVTPLRLKPCAEQHLAALRDRQVKGFDKSP